MLDNKRNPATGGVEVDKYLLPNLGNGEYDGSTLSPAIRIDFYSNGFKIRSTESVYNASGHNFVYACFAEGSFKDTNSR